MNYDVDASPSGSRRNVVVGAVTMLALFAGITLSILARRQTDVPFVVVAPSSTTVELDGRKPRTLPNEPRGSSALVSYYFITSPGMHEVTFQQPGGVRRTQSLDIKSTTLPVIYNLVNDSLQEMPARSR